MNLVMFSQANEVLILDVLCSGTSLERFQKLYQRYRPLDRPTTLEMQSIEAFEGGFRHKCNSSIASLLTLDCLQHLDLKMDPEA